MSATHIMETTVLEDRASLLNQLRIGRDDRKEVRHGRFKGWLAGALAVAGLGTAGWIAFASGRAIPIHVAVARANSESTPNVGDTLLDASGYVIARRQATVSAKITGKVIAVMIDEGQHVENNQIVARLDDTNIQAALLQASAQLEQSNAAAVAAQVAFDNAKPMFRRNEQQFADGLISAQAFDTAKSSYDAARTQAAVAQQSVKVAQAALLSAQRNLDDTIVRAPFGGVITVKAVQPGEIISPISAGGGFTRTGVGTIVDMSSLEVEVDVSENFINRVRSAQPVTVKLNAYPDWVIPAEVIAVIPTADRAKATVKVRIGFKEQDARILPEMGARVAFLNPESPKNPVAAPPPTVSVPNIALRTEGNTSVVYRIHDNEVERRVVRVISRSADGQTIVSGVESGAQLAVDHLDVLKDAAQVRVRQ